jgi:hypothetical protein
MEVCESTACSRSGPSCPSKWRPSRKTTNLLCDRGANRAAASALCTLSNTSGALLSLSLRYHHLSNRPFSPSLPHSTPFDGNTTKKELSLVSPRKNFRQSSSARQACVCVRGGGLLLLDVMQSSRSSASYTRWSGRQVLLSFCLAKSHANCFTCYELHILFILRIIVYDAINVTTGRAIMSPRSLLEDSVYHLAINRLRWRKVAARDIASPVPVSSVGAGDRNSCCTQQHACSQHKRKKLSSRMRI